MIRPGRKVTALVQPCRPDSPSLAVRVTQRHSQLSLAPTALPWPSASLSVTHSVPWPPQPFLAVSVSWPLQPFWAGGEAKGLRGKDAIAPARAQAPALPARPGAAQGGLSGPRNADCQGRLSQGLSKAAARDQMHWRRPRGERAGPAQAAAAAACRATGRRPGGLGYIPRAWFSFEAAGVISLPALSGGDDRAR